MVQRSEKVRTDKYGLPDPLHIELERAHVKILEAVYILSIVGAIVSILIYGTLLGWPREVLNASTVMVMALAVLLGVSIVEKSSVVGGRSS